MKNETREILENLKSGEITIESAQEKLFCLFDVEENKLSIHDIRNKLSPITHLIYIIEDNRVKKEEWLPKALESAKRSVNYLAKREVYPK